MQQYLINAYKERGLEPGEYISCEMGCGKPAIEGHHILSSYRKGRSIDGKTIIFVCRDCHQKIHNNNNYEMREKLLNIVKNILGN